MGQDWTEYTEDPSLASCLDQALREGRLAPSLAEEMGVQTGEFNCCDCGMLHHRQAAARECCAIGGGYVTVSREDAIKRLPPIAGDAVAGVLYPEELAGALIHLKETRGTVSDRTLAADTGLSLSFVTRAANGQTVAWIGRRNWGILIAEFDGDVPGCESYPFD